MSKFNLNRLAKTIEFALRKHAPGILTGVGITGMITTTVMAVKATPKAMELIEDKKYELKSNSITPVEVVKTCWKCYVPAAVTGALSVTCLIGSIKVSARRNAAIGAACSLSEAALREYRQKVVETLGEKKEQEVQDAIAKDRMEKDPVSKSEVVIIDSKSTTLCYDCLSGRYFKSDIDKIKRAEVELGRQMINEMYVSLNDFYWELGLDGTDLGNELGWNISKGYMDLTFSSQLAEDGTPCVVINYGCPPTYDYQRY